MGETTKTAGDSLPAVGQTSPAGDGSTPQQTKTYSELEYHKAISDERAKAGRERKAIEDENTVLKSQLATNQGMIKETQERIANLQGEIEDLSKDDPDKLRLTQKLRALEKIENDLKADRQALEADKVKHAEALTKAEETNREITIWNVASLYEGGDSVKLKDLSVTLGATTEEQIARIANALWPMKVATNQPATPQNPLVEGKPDSLVTTGGGTGKTPTLEELRASTPKETKAKVDSGEWVLPAWRKR